MYEKHFGLSKNPFQSIAEGDAVFAGPEQSKVISDLKTALAVNDSIAVITGPVGVGKTTIVKRALEQTGSERLVAILGRTQVGSEELVDLLLVQFGIARESTGRLECLKAFNTMLSEKASAGARVFIVIEDAERLGVELLEELEALTAADGGGCAGANIILMGPQKLDKLIATPSLERLRQRIRLQQTLERFTAEDVEAYLCHRITAAGGEFDAIFEQGAPLMVRRCSGGIPRVINSLCETALTVAADNNVSRVSGKIIFKVAVEVFGMSPGDAPASRALRPAPAPNAAAATPQAPQAPAAKPPPAAAATPPQAAAARTPQAPVPKAPAPAEEKIADPTTPAKILTRAPRAPNPPETIKKAPPIPTAPPAANNGAAAPAASPQAEPAKPKFEFADEIVVDRETKPNLRVEAPKTADVKPETRKAPVSPPAAAKSTPAQGTSPATAKVPPEIKTDPPKPPAAPAAAPPKPAAAPPKPAPAPAKPAPAPVKPAPANELPELILDEPPKPAAPAEQDPKEATASFAKVDHDMLDAALASLAVHDEEDETDHEQEVPVVADATNSIPEVTLDQSIDAKRSAAQAATDAAELDRMAAELEKTKSLEEMSDQLAETLFGNEELESISQQIREEAAPAKENPVVLEESAAADASEPAPEPKAPQEPAASAKPIPNIEAGSDPAAAPPAENRGPQPEPIENQFNTSMTSTLETLNTRNKPKTDDTETEENSSGLLGRLKDSFKS